MSPLDSSRAAQADLKALVQQPGFRWVIEYVKSKRRANVTQMLNALDMREVAEAQGKIKALDEMMRNIAHIAKISLDKVLEV